MSSRNFIEGFSKLTDSEKLKIISVLTNDPAGFLADVKKHRHPDHKVQDIYSSLSENTLTNYFLPFGVAPNFLINGRLYHVPMVIEESSVVAATSAAAKFWYDKGGFLTRITGCIKQGQIHFFWKGEPLDLERFLDKKSSQLKQGLQSLTHSMEKRGGGVKDIRLLHLPSIRDDYYQLDVRFDTVDSMGANFINACLESLSRLWKSSIEAEVSFSVESRKCDILMSILTNYTPECLVECRVTTDVSNFSDTVPGYSAEAFVQRFSNALKIARTDVNRAVTHNKGIFNGIDAVIVATGNDFRAVEANGHAYAARDGHYRGLTEVYVSKGRFEYRLILPLALGTVGGVTGIHPMVKHALSILGHPSARELMQIVAAAGLASNFSAVRSLISTGIQTGHMKLHLSNILAQLEATPEEIKSINEHLRGRTVTYSTVKEIIVSLRSQQHEKGIQG